MQCYLRYYNSYMRVIFSHTRVYSHVFVKLLVSSTVRLSLTVDACDNLAKRFSTEQVRLWTSLGSKSLSVICKVTLERSSSSHPFRSAITFDNAMDCPTMETEFNLLLTPAVLDNEHAQWAGVSDTPSNMVGSDKCTKHKPSKYWQQSRKQREYKLLFSTEVHFYLVQSAEGIATVKSVLLLSVCGRRERYNEMKPAIRVSFLYILFYGGSMCRPHSHKIRLTKHWSTVHVTLPVIKLRGS